MTDDPTPDGVADAVRPLRADDDLGFGRVVSDESRQRMLRPDGSFNVQRTGLGAWRSYSLYYNFVSASWPGFIGVLATVYAGVSVVFALGFWALGAAALDAPAGDPNGFLRALYFSVQTFATIGYGRIAPVSHAAEALVAVEAFLGVLYAALATGLTFARVARPQADVVFSRRLLVAPYRGGWAVMFRLANARRAELTDVTVEVTFSALAVDPAIDRPVRRYAPLPLERQRVTFFPLTWTIVHPLTPASPMWGLTDADLRDGDAEILARLTALDEGTMQTVTTRTSYRADDDDVVWFARFRDVFDRTRDVLTVDVSRLDERDAVDAPDDWPAEAPSEPQASTTSTGASASVSASV